MIHEICAAVNEFHLSNNYLQFYTVSHGFLARAVKASQFTSDFSSANTRDSILALYHVTNTAEGKYSRQSGYRRSELDWTIFGRPTVISALLVLHWKSVDQCKQRRWSNGLHTFSLNLLGTTEDMFFRVVKCPEIHLCLAVECLYGSVSVFVSYIESHLAQLARYLNPQHSDKSFALVLI